MGEKTGGFATSNVRCSSTARELSPGTKEEQDFLAFVRSAYGLEEEGGKDFLLPSVSPEREEVRQVLLQERASLREQMSLHVFSFRGISCSAQIYTVEHIARQLGIPLDDERKDT